jgi:hypothetical protein
VDGEEIPESPLRIWVISRDCGNQVPDELGQCICPANTVDIGGHCASLTTLLLSILLPFLTLLLLGVYFYVRYKQRQSDLIWKINPDELMFDQDAHVLGRGTFGAVWPITGGLR